MKDRLSGFIDGELGRHDETSLLDALKRDGELRCRWQEYLLIRDAIKGRKTLRPDITARVMDALKDEPAILAPRGVRRGEGWQRPAMAVAATLAGVAVVGWMALDMPGAAAPTAAAPAPLAQSASMRAERPVRQASRDMQEYLVAHQAQSSFLQFRGGSENIRTVAAPAK